MRPLRSGLPRDSVHSHRLGVQVGSTIVLGISLLFVLATHAGALRYGTIDGGWWWFFLVAIYLEAFLAVCCLLDTKLTRASRGPRAVRMGHAYPSPYGPRLDPIPNPRPPSAAGRPR